MPQSPRSSSRPSSPSNSETNSDPRALLNAAKEQVQQASAELYEIRRKVHATDTSSEGDAIEGGLLEELFRSEVAYLRAENHEIELRQQHSRKPLRPRETANLALGKVKLQIFEADHTLLLRLFPKKATPTESTVTQTGKVLELWQKRDELVSMYFKTEIQNVSSKPNATQQEQTIALLKYGVWCCIFNQRHEKGLMCTRLRDAFKGIKGDFPYWHLVEKIAANGDNWIVSGAIEGFYRELVTLQEKMKQHVTALHSFDEFFKHEHLFIDLKKLYHLQSVYNAISEAPKEVEVPEVKPLEGYDSFSSDEEEEEDY